MQGGISGTATQAVGNVDDLWGTHRDDPETHEEASDPEVLGILLAHGANPNDNIGQSETALHRLACKAGPEKAVEILLSHGADAGAISGGCGTAPHAAAYHGRETILEMLLRKGCPVNMQVERYRTALQAAASQGCSQALLVPLSQGANMMADCGQHGTALHAASVYGYHRACRILLEHRDDPNFQCEENGSPLRNVRYRAPSRRLYRTPRHSELFLTSGANANAQAGIYRTALQAAAYAGHKEIVHILLDAGADLDLGGGVYGDSVQASVSMELSEGCYQEDCLSKEDILVLLIDIGADVNRKGGKYRCALAAARTWDQPPIEHDREGRPVVQKEKRYPRGHERLIEILF
ncbi:ankyrin repeat-containing domain protein [Morchella snyderi]|nr:ankyrin repeat-containing domain protein [Morchella snyderi]